MSLWDRLFSSDYDIERRVADAYSCGYSNASRVFEQTGKIMLDDAISKLTSEMSIQLEAKFETDRAQHPPIAKTKLRTYGASPDKIGWFTVELQPMAICLSIEPKQRLIHKFERSTANLEDCDDDTKGEQDG